MTTYDRNRNAITTGSRVMVSGTGHTGTSGPDSSRHELSV